MFKEFKFTLRKLGGGGGTNPHYYKKGGRYRLGVATPKREEVDACSIHCDKLC